MVNDVTWKVLLILAIVLNLDIRLLDVETAFQNGDLDKEIYMEPPEGIEEVMELNRENECMQLLKCTYGLVQAARQYGKKFNEVVKGNGVEPTLVDPGLLLKKREGRSPELYIAQHIDDSLTVGKLEDITKLQEHMNESGLTTKCDELVDYLGCRILFSKDRKK